VFGDIGEATGDTFAVAEQLHSVDFDLALLTGDVGYKSGLLAEFEQHFFDVYPDLFEHVPFYPASGNHDYRTADAGPFRQAFALPENGGQMGKELWYSFDWGNVHFVSLDTEQVGEAQAEWLEADLAANQLPWTIVMGHRPPYSSGHHGGNDLVRRHFVPLFEQYGVQLALFGHDHSYERTEEIDGVAYIVTGGGGVGTRPVGSSSYTEFSLAVSHFVYVQVEGDQLTAWAIDATGQVFDTMQIANYGS
jgi:3',5'-cyclic AMP phosphodiesterase CpdA